MHVNPLAIAPVSVQNRRDDYQLLFGDKVAHAPLVLGRIVLRDGVQVEFEGAGEREQEQQHAADESCYPIHGGGACVQDGRWMLSRIVQVSRAGMRMVHGGTRCRGERRDGPWLSWNDPSIWTTTPM
jgi:hypothetical protein